MSEVHHVRVEERKATLDRVAHEHAVPLRREQVGRQESLDFDELILREGPPIAESFGQLRGQRRDPSP